MIGKGGSVGVAWIKTHAMLDLFEIMKLKITVDGKTKYSKVRDINTLYIQQANRPSVYKSKKKYTRKIKHKGLEEY